MTKRIDSRQPNPQELRGTVQKFKDASGRFYWRARATLFDGSRVWVGDRFYGKHGKVRAHEYADEKTREAEEKKLTLPKFTRKPGENETSDEYFSRLSDDREAKGIGNVRKERNDWSKWISPRIGLRPVAAVTRDEIEDIRNALDAEVMLRRTQGQEHGISGKTAMNIWSTLRITFKESVSARDRVLRVRTDDPTAGHKPPLKSPDRSKTFVYPNEFAKLLACADAPLEWRETYAVAAYTYVRPEELEALEWTDVDFDAGVVHVSKSIDARTGKPKATPKTAAAVRSVPIEPALMPLLRAMHKRRSGDAAPVLPVLRELNDKFRAKLFREHLARAGVKRARITANTLTLRPVDFRSCRDTGITWLALAGVPLPAMQRRAGHEDIAQTNAYVKMAEDLSGNVGAPFPPLPASLLSASSKAANKPGAEEGPASNDCLSEENQAQNKCRRRESNAPRPEDIVDSSRDIAGDEILGDQPRPNRKSAKSGGLGAELDPGGPSDAELERGILDALRHGLVEVAKTLGAQLEGRRHARAGNVVALPSANSARPRGSR